MINKITQFVEINSYFNFCVSKIIILASPLKNNFFSNLRWVKSSSFKDLKNLKTFAMLLRHIFSPKNIWNTNCFRSEFLKGWKHLFVGKFMCPFSEIGWKVKWRLAVVIKVPNNWINKNNLSWHTLCDPKRKRLFLILFSLFKFISRTLLSFLFLNDARFLSLIEPVKRSWSS